VRWLGALLLVGACGGIGLAKTGNLRRRIALLDSLLENLRQLQTELLQRNPPLPDLLEQLEQPALAENVRRGMTMGQAAKPLLQRLEGELPKTAQTLEQLCCSLGRYDSGTQAQACVHALQQLQEQREALSRELAEKGNLYRTVPLAFGLMAALAVL
jgi:stage III sporulation protein AB